MDFKPIPPDERWDKKVRKLAGEYNELTRKIQEHPGTTKWQEKMDDLLVKIEDGLIVEKNAVVRRDYAFLIQLIEDRHETILFTKDVMGLAEHVLGGGTRDADTLAFKEVGSPPAAQQQEQFNIETIDLDQIALANVERIGPDQLERSSQKCAFGDGEILDEKGNAYGQIWRCKSCKTVYHENCLRLTLLVKGSCQVCDVEYLQKQEG